MSVKATWLGHSAVMIEGGGRTILVDPFLTGNPSAQVKPSDLNPDLVLLTHDHEDHFGDTEAFLKKGATFVGIHELSTRFAETGYKVEGMNIGGTIESLGVRITMTHALHTCYTGHVAGFIIEIEGRQIHHAGDTGLSTDMKILGEFFAIDLAFLPIGDRYTMGARSASIAAGWIGAKKVVPIHFGTWPPIQGDPDAFVKLCPVAVILKPGESVRL